MSKISLGFYLEEDVVDLAKSLIGKVLVTNIDGKLASGIISETEAYSETEKGSHAYGGKMTKRTSVMFNPGGQAYVYLCYGMHYLFNIVTGTQGTAKAILIRGIIPLDGIETILERRNAKTITPGLCIGPGKVCSALGISKMHYGEDLTHETIWLEDRNFNIPGDWIETTPRIGIHYAGEDALLPWRFHIPVKLHVSLMEMLKG